MNVGSHIGQYRILRKLGAGGMGTVFLGEHILLARTAAIKTLLPALSVQKEIVERFFNEARATAAIADPGVVQIFDFGYHVDGTAYIVMELLEGEALGARLERLGKLSISDALRITRQVAGSLAAAHERGIVHRDLKPENLFLVRDTEMHGGERTKILDFGICKLSNDDSSITQTGTMLGTPVYMSPEQCRGAGLVDHRSDIYALGCVLFHMLTGRPPFDGEGSGEFIVAHLKEAAPAPSVYASHIPPAIDELVLRCLSKQPTARYQWMTDLQAAIDPLLAELDVIEAAEVAAAPKSMPLGQGFKSAYNGNLGSAVRTQHAGATRKPQLLVMPTPVTHDSIRALLPPPSLLRRAALAVLLVGGVAGALVLTHVLAGNVEAIADSSTMPMPAPLPPSAMPDLDGEAAPTSDVPAEPLAPVAAAPALEREPMPTGESPVTELPKVTPTVTPAVPAVAAVVDRPAPSVTAKTKTARVAATKPRVRRKAPARKAVSRPRPAVTAPAPAAGPAIQPAATATVPVPAEDLYDTR